MRFGRRSYPEALAVTARRPARRLSLPGVAILTGLLALGLFFGVPRPTTAESAEMMQGGVAANSSGEDIGDGGMPASNPRVRPLLAAHPSQFVVICVAGCDGNPKVVQILPRPVTKRTAEYMPSAGTTDKPVYGPAVTGKSAAKLPDDNAVICLAGCDGRPGQVVQRVVELPPPARLRSKPAATALPKPPEPKAEKAVEPKGNEPLDINP